MSHSSEQPHVVVIGTGMSGMVMAMKLKRARFSNFTVIEKASEDNIPLSSDLNPDWVHSHTVQPAIQGYWLQLALKYDLYSNIIFNRKVLSAQWDMRAQKYDMITEEQDGTLTPLTAAIVVSAVGLFEVLRFPDIPGISASQGDNFHTARWDNSVSLAGKRVAVIGGGSSATQHVPIISDDPSVKITQCWSLPKLDTPSQFTRFQVRREHVPFYLWTFRYFHFLWSEFLYLAIFGNQAMNRYVERHVKAYTMKATPAEYMDREAINEDSIFTTEGSVALDIIIYSTGYIAGDYPVHVKGTGQTVAEYYRAQGGPAAYLGTALPGFPKFFTLFGANTATGYSSLLLVVEVQVQYIFEMIKPVIASESLSMEVTTEATELFNRHIQQRLSGTGDTRKIHGLFPGSMILFWWWLRRPNWADFKVMTVGRWEPRRSIYRSLGVVLLSVLGIGVTGTAYLGRI
ncbi:hypothetical protein B0H13DRAFT_2055758 [Mycena leptocephala]|nr:hypothetical protein B0H13DRAFT_2055758 [Mycena leptocephala]